MDSKGIINIELLFCVLIMILLLIIIFPNLNQNLDSTKGIDENSQGRFLLNHISNSINEVNSKKHGFKKIIRLPNSINENYYSIVVNQQTVIVEFNNKKGKSNINPINLVDNNNKTIDKIQLFNGRTYIIKKILVNDNKTDIINQSYIQITQIA